MSEYFFRTKIYWRKSESWTKFIKLCKETDLKNAKGADTSKFAIKVDLANLKSDVD